MARLLMKIERVHIQQFERPCGQGNYINVDTSPLWSSYYEGPIFLVAGLLNTNYSGDMLLDTAVFCLLLFCLMLLFAFFCLFVIVLFSLYFFWGGRAEIFSSSSSWPF